MKIYLVERVDGADYDEFRGFVVRAKNETEALKLCVDRGEDAFPLDSVVITEIREVGDSEIILESFNAG